MVFDAALSDHFCVLFDTTVIVDTRTRSETVKNRSSVNSVTFSQAISMIPSSLSTSVDDLLDNFNSKILSLIKLHGNVKALKP